jgi:preprotein translocase subunit YajC
VADERVKRKQRGSDRMTRGYARAEQRNQEAREALEPLGEGERPTVVTVGAVVAALIALSIVVAYFAGGDVFLIFSAFFGLVVGATSVVQILGTLALLIVAGAFFYFMVKAMARIQMPTREPRE